MISPSVLVESLLSLGAHLVLRFKARVEARKKGTTHSMFYVHFVQEFEFLVRKIRASCVGSFLIKDYEHFE